LDLHLSQGRVEKPSWVSHH